MRVPYYVGDLKGDPDLQNYPCGGSGSGRFFETVCWGPRASGFCGVQSFFAQAVNAFLRAWSWMLGV